MKANGKIRVIGMHMVWEATLLGLELHLQRFCGFSNVVIISRDAVTHSTEDSH
jgi:hypothetical protein